MSHRNPIPETVQRRITKLFVTNLPDGCSGTDLAAQVRSFGQIYDLYIARKRDKGGNRFGFISMLDVKDKGDLLKSLRNIRMGEYKLWFSIAKFVLEDGEINTRRETTRNHKSSNVFNSRMEGPRAVPKSTAFVAENRSFKDSLVGKKIDVDNHVHAFSSMHGKALVVKMVDLQGLKNIKVILSELCQGTGKVQYLGGLDVFVSFEDSEAAEIVLEAAKLRVNTFSSVTIWSGQPLAFERIAWLKVKGIPLHLHTNNVVDVVGNLFGKVVHNASKGEYDHDLSYDIIGVLAGDGKRIDEEVTLNWNGRKFRVWVAEEFGEWIPDFVDVVDKKDGESVDSDSNVSETDDSVEDHSPEVEPVIGEVNDIEVNDAVVQPILETDIEVNGDINEIQSLLNEEGAEIEENNEDTFIPGIDFPFEENPIEEDPFVAPKVNKRKKFKKQELGRPSYGYVSSQESLKNGKKPKNDDMFGLDEMLGLSNKYSVLNAEALGSNSEDSGTDSLDLNKQPVRVEDCVTAPEQQAESQHTDGTIARLQDEEVHATIVLGEKMGTDLSNCNILIQESINQEGLQRGKR
ncbi:hypothetical protein SSX86_011676 [Deinandra increscens subsp. villosa]|uniref:RRM domain-containing protein n=1 Tax=Deinandra increscens subsp. villosa TaxID=3103831 RepID=A0AAP0D7B0_9ASTR